MTPGIIIKQRYYASGKKQFKGYLRYINRKEATRPHAGYLAYMDNPNKGAELFTAGSNTISYEDKLNLEQLFTESEENNGVLWDTIISFDNDWLKENGIYFDEDRCDDDALKDYTREAINKMLKEEGLYSTAIWTAAIHHNTDNVHIHVAITEPEPTRPNVEYKVLRLPRRWVQENHIIPEGTQIKNGEYVNTKKERAYQPILQNVKKTIAEETGRPFFCSNGLRFDRYGNLEVTVGPAMKILPEGIKIARTYEAPDGKFKMKSINTAKSTYANRILREQETNLNINRLIREDMTQAVKQPHIYHDYDPTMEKMYQDILKDLRQSGVPKGRWYYNNNQLASIRPKIDELNNYYIQKYQPKQWNELNKELDRMETGYEKTYGKSNFRQNKMRDYQQRIGNAVLSVMKDEENNKWKHTYKKKRTKPIRKQRPLFLQPSWLYSVGYYRRQRQSILRRTISQSRYLRKKANMKAYYDMERKIDNGR